MNKTIPFVSAAFAVLASTGVLHGHHSSSMFDLTTSIWVRGTVVEYLVANPHARILLEATGSDGEVRQWTIEGPSLRRIAVMRQQPAVGDVIDVCGFALKESVLSDRAAEDPYGRSATFVHGHTLLMPDGRWELFGSYGNLGACIQASEASRESWLDFLDNSDPSVRGVWCGQLNAARRGATDAATEALFDEINAVMRYPCD